MEAGSDKQIQHPDNSIIEARHIADVSVVVANFNNGKYLPEMFDSVIHSTVLPKELIVVDDGSTDNSKEVIGYYSSRYDWIKTISSDINQGVANATNRAISMATGKYILKLDADDVLKPERIEKQYHFMEQHPKVDVLGGNCTYFVESTSRIIRGSRFPVMPEEITARFIRGENGVLNGTVMVRREWFEKFNYRQEMVWAEDYDLFARMLKNGAVFYGMGEPLTFVRIHQDSATSNLKYDTLRKAWLLSCELFGNQRPEWKVKLYYLHLYFYRRYLIGRNILIRWFYLGLAVIFSPQKVLKRLSK